MLKQICTGFVCAIILTAVPALAQQSGWLGVSVEDQKNAGAIVRTVEPNSPAEKAGIRTGDVIVAFNNEKVVGVQQLTRLIRETPVGRTIDVSVQRDGREENVQVTTEAARFPERPGVQVNVPDIKALMDQAMRSVPRIEMNTIFVQSGIRVEQLTDQLRDYFGVHGGDGVLVSSVDAGSAAEKAGLKPGDVITSAGGRDVKTPADFSREMRNRRGSVMLKIVRDKQERDVSLD